MKSHLALLFLALTAAAAFAADQERTLIVLEDGKWKGASQTDGAGKPLPLDLKALAAVVDNLNAAAVARVAELEAQLADQTTTSADVIAAARAVIATPDPTKAAELAAKLDLAEKPKTDREIEELQKKLEETKDELRKRGVEVAEVATVEPAPAKKGK